MAGSDAAQRLEQLTYERQDIIDLSINLKTLQQNCPLAQPSSTELLNIASLQSLGQLDLLPLEVIQSVLQLLDLHSLILMQCVNHRSKLLIDSLPQYREIVTHAPNALRAALSTGLAPHFTIIHLSRALRTQDCFLCGSFGAYLYLLECRRCCWLCLAEAAATLPISRKLAKTVFGLPVRVEQQLPCMQSLPGRYSLDRFNGDTHERRVALVSIKIAKEAGIKLHGSLEALEVGHLDPISARTLFDNRRAGNRNFTWLQGRRLLQNPSRGYIRDPPPSDGFQYAPKRFMTSIRFPTLDPSIGTIEWGFSCKGCRDGPQNDDKSRDWEAMYTKRGYFAHFEQCKWSKHYLTSLETLD